MRKWKRRGFKIFSGKKEKRFSRKMEGGKGGLRNRGAVVEMGNESWLT